MHAGTGELVASAMQKRLRKNNGLPNRFSKKPKAVVAILEVRSTELTYGPALCLHPKVKGVERVIHADDREKYRMGEWPL